MTASYNMRRALINAGCAVSTADTGIQHVRHNDARARFSGKRVYQALVGSFLPFTCQSYCTAILKFAIGADEMVAMGATFPVAVGENFKMLSSLRT